MNRAFSKIWITIVLIILVAGGIFAWQYFKAPGKEVEKKSPYLEILSPNGGEEWIKGNSYSIQWKAAGFTTENVYISLHVYDDQKNRIYYKPGLPAIGPNIAWDVQASQQYFQWKIPLDIETQYEKTPTFFKVKIEAEEDSVEDLSDDYFVIKN